MNKNIKLFAIIPSLIIPALTSCNPTPTVDFALLRSNFKNMLVNTTSINYFKNKNKEQIRACFDKEDIAGIETYKFKDIDYDAKVYRTEFPHRAHLDRALELAIIAEVSNDAELKEMVRKLEYHWVFKNYRSPNWYENEIGTVRSLTNVGIFQYDDLNDKAKAAFDGKVRNGSIYYHPGLELHSGANLIDYAQNTFKSGIITHNINEADCAYNRLMEEIKENDKEGFQDEGSYFQHGRLLSTGSYGNVATSKLGTFFTTLKGSKYKVPKEKLKIVLNCILTGLRYLTHRNYKSYFIEGRGFCDPDPYIFSINNLKSYLTIDGVEDADKKELTDFFAKHDNKQSTFSGIKVFPKARVITSNIDDVFIGFKGTDPITVNSECLNNENELAYNLSYGMNTCIMQSGLEYENLSPVCDFSFMPGAVSRDYGFEDLEVTEEQKFFKTGDRDIFAKISDLKNERFEDKVETYRDDAKKELYVYGYADELANNEVASIYQQGKHSKKTTDKKEFKGQEFTVSCFSTPKGMAILGAGMNDLDGDGSNRYVTLQQCTIDKEKDKVTLDGGEKTLTHNYKNGDIDTNVIYKSLNNSQITLRENTVNGNYKRNHSTYKPGVDTSYTHDTMIAYMPIDNESKYAYSIQTKNEDAFAVASNTTDVQAIVLPGNKKIAAVFYSKDKTKQSFEYNTKKYELSKEFIDGQGAFEVFDIK